MADHTREWRCDHLTARDLRELLKGLPDDAEVRVWDCDMCEFSRITRVGIYRTGQVTLTICE